ncbi:MAG: hypothetical protein EXR07_09635 [Acetobacteraceae bacterium]|nr:hypothetical protein [Acetobacteraceae bacterium]
MSLGVFTVWAVRFKKEIDAEAAFLVYIAPQNQEIRLVLASDMISRNEVSLELAHLKEHFEGLIQANERRQTLREEFQNEAVRVASDSNNSRLEHMNEFRDSLSDQANRMITRTEAEIARNKTEEAQAGIVARFDAELRPVHAKLDEIGRPNWTLMVGVLSVAFVMITGIWLVIGLKIDATLSPVILSTEQIKAAQATNAERSRNMENSSIASSQMDVVSRADRVQLNDRIRALEGSFQSNLADRRAESSTFKAQLVEIESQFKTMSHTINIEKDNTQQFISLLWEKIFDKPLPQSHFRPTLYRE